mgnify:CR=1 FL=1
MNIPTFFYIHNGLFKQIVDLGKENPNDHDLGKKVRSLLQKYNDGEFNPPSDIEFDQENE